MNGFSTEEDSRDGPPAAPFYGQSCCLIDDGDRCVRPAGNASFSKRIQKSISQKKLKLDIDKSVRHLYICDFHKNFIQSVRNKRKRKTSDDGGDSPEHDTDVPEVDLFQLQVNTLRRYKRHYKLQTRPGLNKAQLAEVSEDSSVISVTRKLFISSVQGQILWAFTPVRLAGTDQVPTGRFQGVMPAESCLLASIWDRLGSPRQWLLKVCFSNLLVSASFPTFFIVPVGAL
uniref:SAP30 like n=2 Tax=Passeriformes TaxID=9126 RepID=A0A8C3QCN4_GEOPR